MKALSTELDSMMSLLEVLHQNSLSLRDPQAIADELDNIVQQAEASDRAVRELESLLHAGTGGFGGDLPDDGIAPSAERAATPPAPSRQKVKDR
jgi:hypothetical protein